MRRTARTLGMRTESSARFEKGVDIKNVEYAMERALQLIDELDCGDIVDGAIDRCAGLPEDRVLRVTADSICGLLGVDIPADEMADILNRLCMPTELEGHTLICRVPSFRDDVEGRADLAEEVMRVYGYSHIVGTPMTGQVVRGRLLPERRMTDKVKSLLIAQGAQEIVTYSFISGRAADQLGLAPDDPRRQAVTLLNPLGEEYSTMRTQLLSSMLTVLSTNLNRKIPAARFFEASKLFLPRSLPLTELPDEVPALSLGLYGEKEDFFTLKGLVETLAEGFGVKVDYTRSAEPYLHPGRQARAAVGEETLAVFGELHPDTAARYGLEDRIYVGEVRLAPLFAARKAAVIYKPLPRYPAVERDLALLCDEELPVAEIESVIREAGGKLLESIALFDVYQGPPIGAGKKSVAFSLMFRSPEGTLSDGDIEPALQKIFRNLKEKGCILRS